MKADESPLLRSTFDSQDLSVEESFAIWDESISPLFHSSIKDETERFFVQVEAAYLESLVFVSTKTSSQQFLRNHGLCRKDQADHFLLQLYLTGGYQGDNGKKKVCVQPNDVSLLDVGREIHTQAHASHSLSVVIPREIWLAQSPQNKGHYGMTLTGKNTMGYILGEHIKSLWTASHQARQSEAKTMNETLLSIAFHCFSGQFELDDESDTSMQQATLKTILHYIQANLSNSELSPEKICCAFHCSRSYLYRLFESLGGVSRQIQKQRLAKCYQALISKAGKNQQIAEIAFFWGFNNQSHFSRLFHKVYGISPKQARELGQDLRQAEALLTQNVTEDSKNIPEYRQWFLQI